MATGVGTLWLVVGVVVGVVGWAAATARLPRSASIGRRWPRLMGSDDSWQAAQRAGGPTLESVGALVGTLGLLVILFRPDDDTVAVLTIFVVAGLVIAGVGAAVSAVRAGRRASRSSVPAS